MPLTTTSTSNNIDNEVSNFFYSFLKKFKYIVFIVLYILTFIYLFNEKSVHIAFSILFIFHFCIIFLFISDLSHMDFSVFNFNFPYNILNLIWSIGPIISWILIFITLIFIINVYDKNNYYNNKELKELDKSTNDTITIIKSMIITSTIIIALLYGFNISGVSSINSINDKVNKFEFNSLINRLMMTSFLLISFLIYSNLITFENISLYYIGVIVIILLFLFNIYFKNITTYEFKNNKILINIILLICFLGLLAIIGVLIKFIYDKQYYTLLLLIPLSVWLFYLIYMIICFRGRNFKYKFDFNFIYIVIFLIGLLYILSSLSLYYSIKINKDLKILPQ